MLAVLVILATVGFTSCDELAVEDNPMQAYLTMRTSDVTIKVGETYVRKAVAAGTAVVVYSSSDATVATVDQQGKVTAIAAGTAVITAQTTGYNAEGKKIYLAEEKSYKVTVKPATATSLSLDKTMKVLVKDGAALTLTATVTPSDATFTWTSSDEAIATVNNGVVTPVGLGIATITAKSGDLTATCEVFVGTEVDDVSARNPIQDYDILAGTDNSSAITIPAGCHVAFNGVNTNKGVKCNGEATIYLIDGSTNTIAAPAYYAGIEVGAAGLTINAETAGTGVLTVTGGANGAGIGTSDAEDASQTCGDITINGGTITASGGGRAAGIGTGESWSNSAPTNQTCGDITINGGIVTAIGGVFAAGIGTGISYSSGPVTSNECGTITIGTGVTSVTATKGASSDRIGMGTSANDGIQTCGTITFGTAQVFDGTAATGTWTPSPMVAGTYGGLNLAISGDTWTLTPSN